MSKSSLEWYQQFSQKSVPNLENRVRESEVYLRLPLFTYAIQWDT